MTSLPIHLKCRMTCADYHFNETIFSLLGGEEPVPEERRENNLLNGTRCIH